MGKLTELSHRVFLYSKWHVLSVFVTHSLAFFCAHLLNKDKGLRRRAAARPYPKVAPAF